MGIGTALGTAVLVIRRGSTALPPPLPKRVQEMMARRRMDEKPDVILVADEYATAIALSDLLPWANVVGVAAVHAEPGAVFSNLPAVVNLPNLMAAVENDMLLMVDSERGLLLADPDPQELAHYQAEASNLAPRRRLHLGEAHLPARTVDGRAITVYARVQTLEDVEHALEEGADALHVPFNALLLPADTDDDTTRDNLHALIRAAGGKPLLISDEYALPIPLILDAASRADLTLAVPPMDHLDGMGLGELTFDLNEGMADALEKGERCAMPRLAALVGSLNGDAEYIGIYVERLEARGASRLLVRAESAELDRTEITRYDAWVAAGAANTLPVVLPCPSPELAVNDPLPWLVGAGAAGLETEAESVEALKGRVRDLHASECREALSEYLSRGDSA